MIYIGAQIQEAIQGGVGGLWAINFEVSKQRGLTLIIYDDGSGEGLYGIKIPPKDLEAKLEKGVSYKVSIDSLFKVEEIIDINNKVLKKTVNPFDD